MPLRSSICALLAVVALGACGPEAPTRPWSASDHAHAPAQPNQATPENRQARPQGESPELARARAIAALYRVSCASCHGNTGAGDGPEAPAAMPNFNDPAWQQSQTDTDIATVIRLGRPPMPAFGDQIQGANLEMLVAYIRSLGARPAP